MRRGRRGLSAGRDRTVSNDWVVRYDNRFLQLERQSGLAPARSTVVVCERVEGHAGDSVSRSRDAVDRKSPRRRGAASPDAPARRQGAPAARARRRRDVGRSSVAASVSNRWAASVPIWRWVAGSMKSLWKLPEPWTRRARAHRSLENYRTVFHELPQASSFHLEGDISNELRTGTFLTSFDTRARSP